MKLKAYNNEAKHEATLYTLKLVKYLGATKVQLYTNSKLMTNQFKGFYQAKNDIMNTYLNVDWSLAK